jgi:uncharacterized caspase-like protein
MHRMLFILLAFTSFMSISAHAEDRIALVVGNASYEQIGPLDNPVNDAKLISESLRAVGFEVTTLLDVSQQDLKLAIARFGRELREAGKDATGLFYYAGHGVQSFGNNYLLPVDTSLSDQADLDLVAIEAQTVLRQMHSARNKTNIVILDACRNNPFENIAAFNDNGLAEMKAPTGTFLAYATAPGAVAYDGNTDNSPFSAALAQEITAPGQPIEQMFKNVRVAVLEQTEGEQTPWDTSSLTSDFAFVAEKPLSPAEIEERQLWDSIQISRDPVQVMLFLRAYPNSTLVPAARALLAEAMQEELATADSAGKEPAAAVLQDPDAADRAAFEVAQELATLEGYESYLDRFPEGVFAEFAKTEIAALEAKVTQDPIAEKEETEVAVVAPAEPSQPAQSTPQPEDLRFGSALWNGGEEIIGRTFAELVQGSPIYPPIEGLPDELWKGQSCANCHQWTREALCEQGNFYVSKEESRALSKQHPYGGGFKNNLRTWAANGCQ